MLGEYDDPSGNNYGLLKDYFIGWYVNSSNYYAYNYIEADFGVAAELVGLPDGTLEMRAGANSDGSIDYRGYCLRWIIQEGANAGAGNFFSGTSRVTLPISGIEKSKTVVASYDDFIGEWEMEGVSGYITIEAKEAGSSYLISGLPGYDGNNYPAVTATFEDGVLVLKEQELLDYTHSTYGACKRIFTGVFTYNGNNYSFFWFNSENYQDVPQVVFTAKFQEDGTVNLLPGSCPFGTFVGFRYAWVIVDPDSSNYRAGNNSTLVSLPSSWTPYVPESDDSEIVQANYADFIGTWAVGDVELTIAAAEEGSTYAITGLPNGTYYDSVTAVFDNGTFYVMEQDLSTRDYDETTLAQDAVSGFVGSDPVYPFEGLDKAKIFTAYLKASGNIVTVMGSNNGYEYDGFGYSWSIITPESQYYQKGNNEEPVYLKDVVIKPASGSSSIAPKKAKTNHMKAVSGFNVAASQKANIPQPTSWTLARAELFQGALSSAEILK